MLVNMIYNGELTLPASAQKSKAGYYCLEENGRAWRVKRYSAYCYVENVEIAVLQHNFGRYEIKMTGYPSGSAYLIEGEPHPHIHRSHACWGDLHKIAHYFLGKNDIENFAGVAERLLRSYNGAAAYGGWWSDTAACSVCGGRIEGNSNRFFCGVCDTLLCRACVIKCLTSYWCKNCLPCKDSYCSTRKQCKYHVGYVERNVDGVVSASPGPTGTF